MESESERKASSNSRSPNNSKDANNNPKLSIISNKSKREPGGWKSMPYILGNETFERLAAMGLLANFMVYLKKMYHMDQVSATSLMGLWTGVTSFLPLLGAFLSDAYIGRYWTIAIASIFSFLVPELNHSPPFLMALLLRILTQQILETGSRGFLAVKLNRLLRFLVFLRPFSLSTRSRSATQIKKRESEEEN